MQFASINSILLQILLLCQKIFWRFSGIKPICEKAQDGRPLNAPRIKPDVRVFAFGALALLAYSARGQVSPFQPEVGQPYGQETFGGDVLPNAGQNWSIVQDHRGLIYVANHYGVLEYDGYTWRVINVAGNQTAFSLGVNEQGVVYVGSRGNFGYLAPDTLGQLRYVSLSDGVSQEKRDFRVIWGTHPTSKGIYFQSWRYLFRWDGERLESWESSNRLHTSFVAHDRFFVKRDSVGLLEMVGDSLRLVPGGERFAFSRVFTMLPMEDGSILVGAQQGVHGRLELYRYREGRFMEQPMDNILRGQESPYTFYNGSLLPNGYIALATVYTGVLVIDQNGQLMAVFDEDRQAPEDVNYSFVDRQGGLWLAHDNNGVTHISVPLGLSEFGAAQGLKGNINHILRHQGKLYVATDADLYELHAEADRRLLETNVPFEVVEIEGAGKIHWSLLSFGNELIICTESGVFALNGDESYQIGFSFLERPKSLLRSARYPNRVYAGKENGLGMMIWGEDGWKVIESVGPLSKPITSLAEDADGTLWATMGQTNKELWRIYFDDNGAYLGETRITDQTELESSSLRVEQLGLRIGVIASPAVVYRYDAGRDPALFVDEEFLGRHGASDSLIKVMGIDAASSIAIYRNRLEIGTIDGDGSTSWASPRALQLPQWKSIRAVYTEKDDVVWIGYDQRLLRFDPGMRENEALLADAEPLIRRASMVWADSVLYGGAFPGAAAARKNDRAGMPSIELRHDDNDLRFEMALPDFSKGPAIEYRYMLDGHDKDWSSWTTQNVALYRNIEAGSMQFRVMARSGGRVSPKIATLSLVIRPPWYWTWWSKSIYLIFLTLPIYQIVRFQRARKQLEELEKEREINERLHRANEQLRSANQSLEQANKMKDEFLASASHELRTPLTAILGFTSVLKEEMSSGNLEFLNLIDENGKRLLQTINSLLDLAKLRAGMLQLDFKRIDVGEKAEEVVDLLIQLAKNQGLYLEVQKPAERVTARLDDHCFERILYNLIGNAIKFTRYGGVSVIVERTSRHVLVRIRDTGIGIDESFIPRLFDEFKQEPTNHMRAEGSGLGLTITAELVELMNGVISVESKKGVGSTFTVSFPLADVTWPPAGEMTDTKMVVPSHSAIQ